MTVIVKATQTLQVEKSNNTESRQGKVWRVFKVGPVVEELTPANTRLQPCSSYSVFRAESRVAFLPTLPLFLGAAIL